MEQVGLEPTVPQRVAGLQPAGPPVAQLLLSVEEFRIELNSSDFQSDVITRSTTPPPIARVRGFEPLFGGLEPPLLGQLDHTRISYQREDSNP